MTMRTQTVISQTRDVDLFTTTKEHGTSLFTRGCLVRETWQGQYGCLDCSGPAADGWQGQGEPSVFLSTDGSAAWSCPKAQLITGLSN